MYCLTMDQKTAILRALVEGNSIRSIERMTGHHRDTIMRVLVNFGKQAKCVMNTLIKNLPLNRLQVDELWTFVGKKDKRLTPGVLEELKKRNPKDQGGRRKRRHHQWLTEDIGHPKLREHLASVITLMKASARWDDFKRMLNRALPKWVDLPLFDQPEK